MAACSTTRRNSSERSESMSALHGFAVSRKLAAGRPVLAVAEQIVRLHDLVDLAGAFVDDRALAVPEESADRVLVGVAVRAVDLHRITGGALRRHGGEPLGETGLARIALSLVLQPARSQPQQTRRLIVRLHLRDHFLHQLVLADLDAERLPLLRVLHARIAARANETGGARGHREAALIEREHRDLEPFADLAEQ